MSVSRLFILLVVVESILFCGCCTHKDLTETAQVQGSGILGQRFRTIEQLELIKDKHTHTMLLVMQDFPAMQRTGQIGVVEAGTELRVDQVVRVTELIAILVILPEYYSWNCTLAKIESGPYDGKEVAIGGEGLVLPQYTATIGSPMLVTSETTDKKP
jgi:hypothetical protein